MPSVRPLACTNCGSPLPQSAPGSATPTQCPACHANQQVTLFPAFYRSPHSGASPELVLAAGEAACFYHPEKRAVVPCDGCGRFLCALCDVQLGEKRFCPACLEAGRERGRLGPVERGRMRYDQIVWALLVVPLPLCWLLTPFTATGALGLALWKWRAPPSLVANTRARLFWAMIMAVIEITVMTIIWTKSVLRL